MVSTLSRNRVREDLPVSFVVVGQMSSQQVDGGCRCRERTRTVFKMKEQPEFKAGPAHDYLNRELLPADVFQRSCGQSDRSRQVFARAVAEYEHRVKIPVDLEAPPSLLH